MKQIDAGFCDRIGRVGQTFRRAVSSLAVCVSLSLAAPLASAQSTFLTFDTLQGRPIAISPDGSKLFAINTPDNHLEIFDIDPSGDLVPAGSVQVGMEPTAVAARNDDEIWVVNFLSDSVSVVDVSGAVPRVVRTLHVGDEPSDIVFAGPGGNRAFITTAHRGQNTPYPDGDFDQEGIGRADIWVFDATNLGIVAAKRGRSGRQTRSSWQPARLRVQRIE